MLSSASRREAVFVDVGSAGRLNYDNSKSRRKQSCFRVGDFYVSLVAVW